MHTCYTTMNDTYNHCEELEEETWMKMVNNDEKVVYRLDNNVNNEHL